MESKKEVAIEVKCTNRYLRDAIVEFMTYVLDMEVTGDWAKDIIYGSVSKYDCYDSYLKKLSTFVKSTNRDLTNGKNYLLNMSDYQKAIINSAESTNVWIYIDDTAIYSTHHKHTFYIYKKDDKSLYDLSKEFLDGMIEECDKVSNRLRNFSSTYKLRMQKREENCINKKADQEKEKEIRKLDNILIKKQRIQKHIDNSGLGWDAEKVYNTCKTIEELIDCIKFAKHNNFVTFEDAYNYYHDPAYNTDIDEEARQKKCESLYSKELRKYNRDFNSANSALCRRLRKDYESDYMYQHIQDGLDGIYNNFKWGDDDLMHSIANHGFVYGDKL